MIYLFIVLYDKAGISLGVILLEISTKFEKQLKN